MPERATKKETCIFN